ncbi:hypothetical protein QBC32DRAFT_338105 [Pseudoneurospora amorphoporcata]|uniref:Uncharacterized protein n=1 Tax=Pseudoneurospora amorphoporcata TaxID=241081 RepID=A0AAN6NX88_9PEZI|nr:hypothetical protein QBC32DRAFT_338105 [Pseudoneurospora amorphoporcata]
MFRCTVVQLSWLGGMIIGMVVVSIERLSTPAIFCLLTFFFLFYLSWVRGSGFNSGR